MCPEHTTAPVLPRIFPKKTWEGSLINRQGNEEFDQEIEEEEEENKKLELGPVLDIVDPFEIRITTVLH